MSFRIQIMNPLAKMMLMTVAIGVVPAMVSHHSLLSFASAAFSFSSSYSLHSHNPSRQLQSSSQRQWQKQRQGQGQTRHFSTAASNESTTTTITTTTTQKQKWFPRRPEEALQTNYNEVVKAAHVRHVLVETEDMADLALQMYLRGGMGGKKDDMDIDINIDPFGTLARDLSACVLSREEGGKVGWIDNPFRAAGGDDCDGDGDGGANGSGNEAVWGMLPEHVIRELFRAKPKGGDVLKIPSSTNSDSDTDTETKQRWHLCRVDDILVDYIPNTLRPPNHNEEDDAFRFKQKGINKVITDRSNLRGSGILPLSPTFSSSSSNNNSNDETTTTAKTYHIQTTGCQMNASDSERLEGQLRNTLSLLPSPTATQADVVLLNTCSIRDHAEQKLYDALGPHAARKRRGERVAIVVAGCVAQQEGEALLRRVPEVDLVMGPQYVGRLGDLLEDVGRGHQVVATDPTLLSDGAAAGGGVMDTYGNDDLSRPIRNHDVRAWVPVVHGCNEHCTYCVVPGVRGVEQSRSPESILAECLALGQAGYKEVTLLGQNVDAYGRDMVPKRTFAELLHYLDNNLPPGTVERVRYVTSHPRYFSDRVIDAVADLDKICECFHVPFQSGDDEVLKRMRRGYTRDKYLRIVGKIREKAPDASICGDVIVGFPGETEEAFQNTLKLMEEVKFDNLNTFAYSPRPNTEAALFEDQIDEKIKAERLRIVQDLAVMHGLDRSKRYLGRVVEVLVEDRNPRNVDQVMGRTRQNRQVFFDGKIEELKGKLVYVKIVEARPWSLIGESAEH